MENNKTVAEVVIDTLVDEYGFNKDNISVKEDTDGTNKMYWLIVDTPNQSKIYAVYSDSDTQNLASYISNDIGTETVSKEAESFEKPGGPWWYFTTHGVQPGSVPNDINIEKIIDTPNGSYFLSNKVLTTQELNEYEIKERKPDESLISESATNLTNVAENVNTADFKVGDIVNYHYATVSGNDVSDPVEKELQSLSQAEAKCVIKNMNGDNEGNILVDFDISENKDKNLQYSGEYIVMPSELEKIDNDNDNATSESVDMTKVAETAEDKISNDKMTEYPALLVAIDSEREAEVTYKSLIEIEKSSDTPNQEVIDLLEHILKDELEHIALLSALAAKNNSEYVAEDSEKMFNDYVDTTSAGE